MSWQTIQEYITLVAGTATSLTIIFGFIYKYVWAPWEKRKAKEAEKAQEERMRQDKEYQDQMLEIARQQVDPIREMVDGFREIITESQYDRKNLNKVAEANRKILESHEVKLDDHDKRLIVLETKSEDGHQKVTYREHYYGKDDK